MGTRRQERGADGLTDIERRFVAEFLIDLDQGAAMKRADGGTREKNWRQLGYQMARREHVKVAIEAARVAQGERLQTTADDVLREIQRMAMFDPANLINVKSPEDIAKLPEETRRAIVGWSWDRHGRFTIKMAKESMLALLAQHHGLVKQKVEHSGPNGGPIPVSPVTMSDEQLAAIAARALPNAAKS